MVTSTDTPPADSRPTSWVSAVVSIALLATLVLVLPNTEPSSQGKWHLLEETEAYVKHVDTDMKITYNRDGVVVVSIRCNAPLPDRLEVYRFQDGESTATALVGCRTGTPTQAATKPWEKYFKDLPKDVRMKR